MFLSGTFSPPSSSLSSVMFGNAIWNPETGAITGMPDAILAWFYGHNIVGLFLTPLAIAVAYFIIPIVSGRHSSATRFLSLGSGPSW